MTKFGIMQGRLVPPDGGRLQSFPRARWSDEFALAASVPLSYIEWIYDAYGENINPLCTAEGEKDLLTLQRAHGVQLRSMCADWFMDFPLLRCSDEEQRLRQKFLTRLLKSADTVGITRIVLPFVDASRIDNSEDAKIVCRVLQQALPLAEETGIELHLETSLDPTMFAALLDCMQHPLVKVNYDIGNSASLGYSPAEEFAAYGMRIGSVHIKDRILGGGTVPLGQGNADFEDVFARLKLIGYSGDFTMQIARGEPDHEVSWAQQNLAFILRYWKS